MKIPEKSPTSDGDEVKDVPIPLQTKLLGVWTVFSLPSSSNFRSKLPGAETFKKFHESLRSFPIIWRFLSDAMKIGPWLFPLYVGSNILGNTVSVLQLYNETVLLSMVQEATVANKPVARDEFIFAGSIYAFVVIAGWLVRTTKTRTSTVLENRLIHHFKAELLTAQSSLDLPTTENPEMKRKVENAIENAKGVWDTLKGLVDAASVTLGALGQISVLAQAFGSNLDVQLFLIVCVFRPWLSTTWWSGYMSFEYYAMVTDTRWLNMLTLFELGTDILYKKEVLGSNLDEYIKPAYQKYKAEIGDILISDPETQLMKSEPITYKDIDAVFNSLPLLVFAYRSMRSSGRLDLSKLMLMQRASDTVENFIYKAIDNTNTLKGALKSIYSLYEIIDAQPAMVDGDVNYPEEEFIERKGMSLEFRSVYFSYPQKSEAVLKDMSFTIQPGQLCVIVGENGCGKSTTVQLFTRLYDIVSGDILVDGRSLREFKLRDIRAAASVMYQDYKHLPLTVYENILIGNPDVSNPHEEVEKATKLGGAYDIVQKLPLKFETNLEPRNTGFSRAGWKTSNNKAFERFADEQKPTKLSGGEWQRLALSRSFMKNSEEVRLLCYDEPSASLDPKAEQEVFERLVNLRGEKTMVFITHRFGNLTKHADIILYMKEGHIIEQGTHTELLERGGEYAKMYNIQAEAFSEAK